MNEQQPPSPSTDPQQVPGAQQIPQAPQGPPHPFATPQVPDPSRPRGRGLAIAAMATGLVALLTVAVSFFYLPGVAIVGSVIGFAAIVLGIIALIMKQPPVPGIVGAGAGLVAIIAAIVVGILALGSFLAGAAGAGAGTAQEGPDGPPGAAVEWPANFASGGILFTKGGDGVTVQESKPLAPNAFPESSQIPRDGNLIHVYLDYRCPYCAQFDEANGELLEELVTSGDSVVMVTPLTFLDNASQGSQYSSRTAGAMACIASAEPDLAWAAHSALGVPENQPAEGTRGPSDGELVELLDRATGGLEDETKQCISEGHYVDFAQALGDWATTNPVPDANDPALTVQGTPLVIVNGEVYDGAPADHEAFVAFLEEQGISAK
ncbi:thioredoxin domain-containing protein [Leucobacter luti]|uniref:thioredoxin domain-containing protein n=1 Tax=Leucobacter luti TaxID=340320 RepID=UPI003D05B91E